jgi:hypothetical protein
MGEPCGVPESTSEIIPPSNTPARSHARSSFNICRSTTRRSTWPMRASWSISSKQALMSASSTHWAPWLAATRIASSAWWADRFGRNPKLTGRKSASKIGSRTNLAAVMTTRSRTVGIPSGRVWPGLPGLGMCTRRNGWGRYVFVRSSSARPSRNARTPSTPPSATAVMLTPSTPGAPWLAATSTHALHRTSLRATLSKRAWNRRWGSCLALRYSTRWRARTGSTPAVWLTELADCSALIRAPHLLRRAPVKQGPFARAGLCCPDRHHYYDPLRLPLGRLPLPGVTGYRQGCFPPPAGRGRGGPPQFPGQPSDRSEPPTPEGSSVPAPGSQAPSMAFALPEQARLPLDPPTRAGPA